MGELAMNRLSCHDSTAALCRAAALMLAAVAGCSSSAKPPGAAAPASAAAPAATQSAAAKNTVASACEMVTAAQMTAILGVAASAKDTTHSSGETECRYAAPSGFPAVDFAVDWGDGEIAMRAVNIVNAHEPGIASPYDGIGDQAAAVGPALMIRTGDDLVKLVFTGVEGAPAKAKKIFDTAKARM
jgi:Protein of unknown function (DUF3558)